MTVQTGCGQYCSYCVVPYARGKEVNRSFQDILQEIRELAQNGCVEITLLGQIINNYATLDGNFAKLLREINKIDGIQR